MQRVQSAPVEALPEAASLHRVGGTVRRGLHDVDGVPEAVLTELRVLQDGARVRHLLHVGVLHEIASAFEAAGLTWLVMKGPVVASMLYTDPGDRAYGDLDLLVDRADFPAAVRALEEMGYRHAIRNWALAERQIAGQIELSTDVMSIDLHWNLHYDAAARESFDLRPREMLGRSRVVSLGPLNVPTFDPADTLVSLCFHAARSDGHRLMWLKDIERSLAVDYPDLSAVVERARRYDIGPPVGMMLARAQRILGAPVPDGVVEALDARALVAADRVMCALVDPIQFDERGTATRLFTRSVRRSIGATLAEIPARVVRLGRRRLFPPPENETDDPAEKERFLATVAGSS